MGVCLVEGSQDGCSRKRIKRRDDPDPIRDAHDATRADPGATRADPDSTRAGPDSTRADPGATRAGPDSTRADPDTTRAGPDSTRADPGATRADPDTTRDDPGVEQEAKTKIHGEFFTKTCNDCLSAEQDAQADRADAQADRASMIEELRELRYSQPDEAVIADGINNPGDHECPSCRFRTLLLDASRCPKCHSNISPDYWVPVRRQLALQREAEELRARIEAEAMAQAAIARAEAAEREAKDRQRQGWWTFLGWILVAGCVLGVIASINSGSTTRPFPPSPTPVVPPRARIIFYSVTGVARGDTLSVRRGPGANNAISARLPNGFHGIRIVGAPTMNGTTEWVHIEFRDGNGWVTRQYLQPE
jgi:hypothetical protein